jgi:hypothetical protein
MRLISGLAAVALLAALPTTAPAQDADPRLTAFQESCVPGARSYEKTKETLAATGWNEAEESANPELQTMMGVVREQLVPDEDIKLDGIDLYEKEVGGLPLYAVVVSISAGEFTLVSCYVYDFDAAEEIPEATLTAWLGADPVEETEQPGVIVSRAWQNAPNLEAVEVRSNFIPDGSPGSAMTGFSGLGLSVSGFTPGPGDPQ